MTFEIEKNSAKSKVSPFRKFAPIAKNDNPLYGISSTADISMEQLYTM